MSFLWLKVFLTYFVKEEDILVVYIRYRDLDAWGFVLLTNLPCSPSLLGEVCYGTLLSHAARCGVALHSCLVEVGTYFSYRCVINWVSGCRYIMQFWFIFLYISVFVGNTELPVCHESSPCNCYDTSPCNCYFWYMRA